MSARSHATHAGVLREAPRVAGSTTDVTRPRGDIEADGWPLMLGFVSRGLGVAIVNGTCVAPRGAVLRPVPELGTVTYRLLTRHGAALSAEALQVADAIRRTCASR